MNVSYDETHPLESQQHKARKQYQKDMLDFVNQKAVGTSESWWGIAPNARYPGI